MDHDDLSGLPALLAGLGVPEVVAASYVTLLADPESDPEQQDALVEWGLAQESAEGSVRVVAPRWSIGALVQRRREALLAEESTLVGLLEAAEEAQSRYDRMVERRSGPALVEILHGPAAAGHAVETLVRGATRSFHALQPGPTVAERHEVASRDLALLARGVTSRTIYSSVFLAEPGALKMARTLSAAGERSRVHDGLPLPMLVIDEMIAVLPTDRDGHPSKGAAIVKSSAVVAVCVALFEALWSAAVPLDPDAAELNADTIEIARLLLMGFHDERIARETGKSVRTVRRRVSELMDERGAQSRVQLGAHLGRILDW